MVQPVGDEGRHALLVVDRLAHLHQLSEGGGHLQTGGFDEIAAGRGHQHAAGLPRKGKNLTLGVFQVLGGAGDEIFRIPVCRRLVGILDKVVERREPIGRHPAARVNKGQIAEIVGRALGGELEVHALVVDRKGLLLKVDLEASFGLELRQIGFQIFVIGALKRRTRDADPGEFLGLPAHRRDLEADGQARRAGKPRAQDVAAMALGRGDGETRCLRRLLLMRHDRWAPWP